MTRVIAGRFGGRRLATPKGAATRPTSDRVREALFARLESLMHLDGAAVLDLYAGSGALGLEALSRGAARVLLVDKDRGCAAVMKANIAALDAGGQVQLRSEPVRKVLAAGPPGGSPGEAGAFDLVLLDPPYPLDDDAVAADLAALVEHGWLMPEALVVLERSSRSPQPRWPAGLVALESRAYGETTVHLADAVSPAPASG